MALVRKLERTQKDRIAPHEEIEATYTVFTADGKKYLQIDTYGSKTRKIPNKVSQSLQFDSEGIAALRRILETEIR